MKEFLKKIKHKLKALIPFRKLNPHTYWNGLLYIFFVVLVILIFFSLYILYEIKNQQTFEITPKSIDSPSLTNEVLLKKVTESFNENLAKEKEVLNDVKSYKDPSVN